MKLKSVRVVCALALVATAAACQKSSPTRPSDTVSAAQNSAVTDAVTGITLTTPGLSTPADGTRFKFSEQPLTLTVKNAATTGKSALTYTFQVATDSAFASIIYSRDGVAQGAGTTSLQIDKLSGNKDYFWRSRVSSGSTTGLLSRPRGFNVGPEVVIQTPVLLNPQNNTTSNGASPTLTTNNATVTGPAGAITYKFDVSDSSTFTNLIYSTSVAQGPGQTSMTIPTSVRLTANATYFWRVQAIDSATAVTSSYSSVFSFKFVPFDMTKAIMRASPADMGFWPETAKITLVDLAPDGIVVDFDRRDGPDRWPDESFGGGSIEYTLGMCLNISGQWYCSAVVQFWYGRELSAGGLPGQVSYNWFYDPARWGPMAGYQPQPGETVGFFVGSGNLRGRNDPGYVTCPRICERSNVALVPWSEDGSGYFTFSSAVKSIATRRR
jgi:hypothetical protein